jgi:hypothetical protein
VIYLSRTKKLKAPVLTVISEYLNQGNTNLLFQTAQSWQQQDPARLLARVAHELLEREHSEKSQAPLRSKLSTLDPTFNEWTGLYTPDEQCLRLLAKDSEYELSKRPPPTLPFLCLRVLTNTGKLRVSFASRRRGRIELDLHIALRTLNNGALWAGRRDRTALPLRREQHVEKSLSDGL